MISATWLLKLPLVVVVSAGLCVAQGNWSVRGTGANGGTERTTILNKPTSDKDVNVTVDANSTSAGVWVHVFDDTDGDGIKDAGETLVSTTWIKKGDSATAGVPKGMTCTVECGTATSESASGTWALV